MYIDKKMTKKIFMKTNFMKFYDKKKVVFEIHSYIDCLKINTNASCNERPVYQAE